MSSCRRPLIPRRPPCRATAVSVLQGERPSVTCERASFSPSPSPFSLVARSKPSIVRDTTLIKVFLGYRIWGLWQALMHYFGTIPGQYPGLYCPRNGPLVDGRGEQTLERDLNSSVRTS